MNDAEMTTIAYLLRMATEDGGTYFTFSIEGRKLYFTADRHADGWHDSGDRSYQTHGRLTAEVLVPDLACTKSSGYTVAAHRWLSKQFKHYYLTADKWRISAKELKECLWDSQSVWTKSDKEELELVKKIRKELASKESISRMDISRIRFTNEDYI